MKFLIMLSLLLITNESFAQSREISTQELFAEIKAMKQSRTTPLQLGSQDAKIKCTWNMQLEPGNNNNFRLYFLYFYGGKHLPLMTKRTNFYGQEKIKAEKFHSEITYTSERGEVISIDLKKWGSSVSIGNSFGMDSCDFFPLTASEASSQD